MLSLEIWLPSSTKAGSFQLRVANALPLYYYYYNYSLVASRE